MPLPNAVAVILAAGRSTRLPGEVRKPLRIIAGKPVLRHAVEAFVKCEAVSEIVLVVNAGDVKEVAEEFAPMRKASRISAIVAGGKTRAESAKAGVEALKGKSDYIMLHDGARPLVTVAEIEAVLRKAADVGGAILAIPASDTVKRADEQGIIVETVPRGSSWLAQTPQAFRLEDYKKALAVALAGNPDAYTDDAQIMEGAGHLVAIVPGSPRNIKITYPDDLAIVESYLLP